MGLGTRMIDYDPRSPSGRRPPRGESFRQIFIAEFALAEKSLETKRAALRASYHAQGKYFIGEESLAKQNNGTAFNRLTAWRKPNEILRLRRIIL